MGEQVIERALKSSLHQPQYVKKLEEVLSHIMADVRTLPYHTSL